MTLVTSAPAPQALAFSEHIATQLRHSETRVVVTGAGGWLGRASLEMLESVFGPDFPDRVVALGSRARYTTLRSGAVVSLRDLTEIGQLPKAPTLLLHYAYLTKDKTCNYTPEEYSRQIGYIRERVGNAIATLGITRLLLPSSGAVYGLPTSHDYSLCRDPVRNPYGAQKIEDEQWFLRLCREHNVRAAIPRVFNLSGPYINKHESYAISSIINAVLAGGPIVLRAAKRVIRAYTSIRDLLDVSIGWLFSSGLPESIVFDTGSCEPVEVGELATCVLRVMKTQGICIERPPLDGSPDDKYLGDFSFFMSMAERQGVVLSSLENQIADTTDYLRLCRAAAIS